MTAVASAVWRVAKWPCVFLGYAAALAFSVAVWAGIIGWVLG